MKYFVCIPLVVLLLCSCARNLPPAEYAAYLKDTSNGLCVSENVGMLNISLQYIPVEWAAYTEADRYAKPYDSVLADLQDRQFYELILKDTSGKADYLSANNDRQIYADRLHYLLTGLAHDVVLVDGKDTLKPLDTHFERTYGLLPYNKILLAFPKGKKTGAGKMLLIHDAADPENPITLTLASKHLRKLPNLAIAP